VRTAKFVARKQWVVAGADDMFIRVYNHNTMEKIKSFEAHTDYIRCSVASVTMVSHVQHCVRAPVLYRSLHVKQCRAESLYVLHTAAGQSLCTRCCHTFSRPLTTC
jgi:hypothetical protein